MPSDLCQAGSYLTQFSAAGETKAWLSESEGEPVGCFSKLQDFVW